MGAKEGMRFVAVGMPVKSKPAKPIEMGAIMLRLADDSGKSFGNMLGVPATCDASFPSENTQDEHDAKLTL